MATFNMTLEMANEYYRATDGGAHPPWTKEQRAAMVQAGRIKLPDHDFAREYLGEWRDHADAMAYATTATRPAMVHQKCALCSTVLDLGPESTFAQTYEATMAAHHAVCPKRPIEVEDRVRVVRTTTNRLHGALGVVVEVDDRDTDMPYRVKIDGDSYEDGWWCYEVERIPHPAAARAIQVFPANADRSMPCPTCRESWGAHYGIACLPEDKNVRCKACDVPLGEHLKFVGCRGPGSKPITRAPGCEPSAPVLVDGLTIAECRSRWFKNRQRLEPSTTHGMRQPGYVPPPLEPLTPAQIAAAKASQAEIEATWWPQELRVKVAASAEAERNRVRVDLEVEPWE